MLVDIFPMLIALASLTMADSQTTTISSEAQTTQQQTSPTTNVNFSLESTTILSTTDANTDSLFSPKNCTRQKVTSTTAIEPYTGTCQAQTRTCNGILWWRECHIKYYSRSCTRTRLTTKYMLTTEAICCSGLVPYNDTAPFCMKGCNPGLYGDNCSLVCNCTGNTEQDCDLITGQCKCKDGWTGSNCSDVCDDGFYGHNCENVCPCDNNSTCDHVNGTCNCTSPGFVGDTCNEECPEGKFGVYCTQKCSCPANSTCDTRTGECQCIAGLTGTNCTQVCDDGYFGPDCEQTCTCIDSRTRVCDPVDGKCTCKSGWRGRNCGKYCAPGTYGNSCQETCNCTASEVCHPMNGQCLSRFLCDVNGTSNCDVTQGTRDCSGVMQQNLSIELPHGFIQDILNNPKETCDSVDYETQFCVPANETIFCECLSGWTGYSCEKACPTGMYGDRCNQTCTCNIGEECNHISGLCFGTGSSDRQKSGQNATNVGLVLGLAIPGTIVLIVILLCAISYHRKGDHMFRNLQMTVRKTRTASQRSFAENQTYELTQPDIIAEAANKEPLMSDAQRNENDNSHEKFPTNGLAIKHKHDAKSSKDNYSRVVRNTDGSYDNFESMKRLDVDDSVYSVNQTDDVYNNLNHKNGREVVANDDEYSHANFASDTGTYDVMSPRRIDTTSEDNMYDTSREVSNTYDVFQKKDTSRVMSDSLYDTQSSIATESKNNKDIYELPS